MLKFATETTIFVNAWRSIVIAREFKFGDEIEREMYAQIHENEFECQTAQQTKD